MGVRRFITNGGIADLTFSEAGNWRSPPVYHNTPFFRFLYSLTNEAVRWGTVTPKQDAMFVVSWDVLFRRFCSNFRVPPLNLTYFYCRW
ncbi:hypothetical protein TNCV_57711 [Trichonephila clavipes]|nr:hypothetical protein TNCV_57711 [Trichonephila clavipes]